MGAEFVKLNFTEKTYVMGIINATPDSFSDGGKYNSVDRALYLAESHIKNGADILDIGGESTRPFATYVTCDEEMARVIPIIEAIAKRLDILISIDTYKAQVAEVALSVGAHIINDVWGGKADEKMGGVAARAKCPIILMHNRKRAIYDKFMREVCLDLMSSVNLIKDAGVKDEQIILDPGFGFGKTMQNNLTVLRNLDQIADLGFPVLLGTSRKSTIGKILGDSPVDERLPGTIATTCFGIAKGANIVRVHDVKEVAQAVKMMDAILRA